MYPRCAASCRVHYSFAVSRTHMCTPRATPSPSDLPSSLKRTWTPRTCFSHARARGTRPPPHPAAWSQPVIEWWWMEVTYGLPRSTVASAASLDPSAKNLGTPQVEASVWRLLVCCPCVALPPCTYVRHLHRSLILLN